MNVVDSFPRQYARTQRLTLGEPRTFTVSPDGSTVLFLRSRGGDDPVNMLWLLDVASGTETLVLDPRSMTIEGEDSAEEARRRERMREGAGGIVAYNVDARFTTAVTVLGGRLLAVDLADRTCTAIPVAPGIYDARPNHDASMIAYVRSGSLWVTDRSGNERLIAGPTSAEVADGSVTWGIADFAAAEEMGRHRGYWWSPTGDALAVCRVDNSPVAKWHIADPSRPESAPVEHRYPAAGTDNAVVSLHIVEITGAGSVAVRDVDLGSGWEYLTTVAWNSSGLIAQTQTRDQRRTVTRSIDAGTGTSSVIADDVDEVWVEIVPGTPALADGGVLVTSADRDGARRLLVDGAAVTPPEMQVRSVAAVGNSILFTANPIGSPRQTNLWRYRLADGGLECVVDGDCVAGGTSDGDGHSTVVRVADMDSRRAGFTVVRRGATPVTIANHAEEPLVEPNVSFHEVGPRGTQVAVVLPRDGGDGPLPVIFSPYGGPHAQMVVSARNAYASAQWFADQGFCVVVADNRGTPGRGSAYERAVHLDLATPVLEDQVEVARSLPSIAPRADVARVAIRGWSFGGYLAALAVLRAPDSFHCAVAGAPVTEWRLYDTHYTERYLGDPTVDPAPYEVSGLLGDAARLRRPLLLIHGLADDNVVSAHTLRLSSALLAAGRPHEVLPLSGVTHMTPDEVVAENLLLHQLEFIRRSLATVTG